MSDKATRLRRFLDGEIDANDVKDDPLLASLASRIYGVEAEDFEELPLVDDVIVTPGVDIGAAAPPAPGDPLLGIPPPAGGSAPSIPSPTVARDKLSRSAARRRLQGTFPVYLGLLLLGLTVCNFFGLFGGVIGEICQGDSKYCPPNQNKIAILSIGEIDTNQGWADELTPGFPDIAMVIGSIVVLFYGMSLRNRGRRLLEFKAVADIIAEDGRVTEEEAVELRDAASRLGISPSQHSSIARELQSMADDGVDLLPGLDTSEIPSPSLLSEHEDSPSLSMIDLPPPLPSGEGVGESSDSEDEAEVDGDGLEAPEPEAPSDDAPDKEEVDESDSEPLLPSPDGESEPPPIPSDGLPNGWTEEQWRYYGQQYLDSLDDDSNDADVSDPDDVE